jgi:serine/threonine protein kinase
VAEAMSCLHSIGVSHNNLRPENVIFDEENGIKVVGLDMTSIYWDSEMEQMITKKKILVKDKKQLSQVNHMPPEAFQSDAFDPSMADVWSLGLLLCQMIAKQNPLKVKSEQSFEDQRRVFTESHQF